MQDLQIQEAKMGVTGDKTGLRQGVTLFGTLNVMSSVIDELKS